MRFLLDTHILLWWLGNDNRLPPKIRSVISNPENIIFISSATVWEMSIKKSLGKLSVPNNLLEKLNDNNFTVLNITAEHGLSVTELPLHHKDPFDRMLIAQALIEQLTIITIDTKFILYDVCLLMG
ncbi:type II toxin-antitoxin system VapC family toxin [Cyanobacterium sp. IPPAS B-1200]|uniref:type II toxin-antitoxin system VapC family toxin n=1 Tax=Cyanobacterium sp. IPPAS B-1200 TaxID=1562720 RepID=UPI0008525AAD|nr:type II toxin-antitoxin system VapC family toxin [Cyanobacterium sp. IPPAS B-1200]OEJ79050.1 twitching motility protein PilT [Cyanobacterium sp. IPPAS B-1200]